VLTCDVSAGIGLIIASHKQISRAYSRRRDRGGAKTTTVTSPNTASISASPAAASWCGRFLRKPSLVLASRRDYYGASGEVTVAAGLGANVLVGGSEFAPLHCSQFR
jgi:hypothetical protein